MTIRVDEVSPEDVVMLVRLYELIRVRPDWRGIMDERYTRWSREVDRLLDHA